MGLLNDVGRKIGLGLVGGETTTKGAGKLLSAYLSHMRSGDEMFLPAMRNLFYVEFDMSWVKNAPVNTEMDENIQINKLGFLVNSLELPSFCIDKIEEIQNGGYGVHQIVGSNVLVPDSRDFSINFMDTQYSIHENFFLNWMSIVVGDCDLEKSRPSATVTITMFKNDRSWGENLGAGIGASIASSLIQGTAEGASYGMDLAEADISMIYRLHDVFPVKIKSPITDYSNGDTVTFRPVDFKFNSITFEQKGVYQGSSNLVGNAVNNIRKSGIKSGLAKTFIQK